MTQEKIKIAYNSCHGRFSLSHAAMLRYAQIAGLKIYPEKDDRVSNLIIYWKCPPEERTDILEGDDFYAASLEERAKSNRRHDELILSSHKLIRTDPILIQVIEELGSELASGRFAKLAIAEVPKGERYRIDEHDGHESVMTVDDYEWQIA